MHIKSENNIPTVYKRKHNQPHEVVSFNGAFLLNKGEVNFKGTMPKVTEAIKAFGEDFGEAAGKHFDEIIKKSGLKISDDAITFNKEEPFLKRALEIISYPVVGLPIDLANTVIGGLQKISWCKNSTWLSDLSVKPFLKNRREAVENKSNVAAIKHYFELLSDGDKYKRFTEGHARLKPLIPNYNSESERSLTRIVTGLIPAFFLANDAYNLSMYMNNNKDLARKEKKRRFNQEVLRIGATSLLTYQILHLFSKQSNKYMGVAVGLISGITLVSEIIGRSFAGNPVLPLNAQKAKEYALKREKSNQKEQNSASNKKTESSSNSLLNKNNILKTIAGLILFGFTVEKVSNIKTVKAKLAELNKSYKGLFTEKYTISRERFSQIMDKLHENDFKRIVYSYENMVKNQKGGKIELGTIENKKKQIIIHQILTFPVRFVWQALNLPYKVVSKPIAKLFNKKAPKVEKEFSESKMLQESLRFLDKIKDEEEAEFTKKVNKRLVSSFDNLTKSSYSNADLSTATRITSNAVTSGFLIADSFNMVMIDSQGDNKDLAEEKAKERTIQRAIRIAYGAFITKITNDLFKGIYNSSLLGAQAVNVGNAFLTETLERKSVGLPLHEATREEIKENEKIHMSATGIKGSYFRAMAKITGKNSFANNKNS